MAAPVRDRGARSLTGAARPAGRPAERCGTGSRPATVGAVLLLPGLCGAAQPAPSVVHQDPSLLSTGGSGVPTAEAGAQLGRVAKQAFADLEARWDDYLGARMDQAESDRLLIERIESLRTAGVDDAVRLHMAFRFGCV